MKLTKLILLGFLFAATALMACQNGVASEKQGPATKTEMAGTGMSNAEAIKEKLLRHVVLFKFKDDSTEADVNELNDAFNALPDSISIIKEFEWGINNSPEGLDQGFTHCYLLTFASEEDRDSIYLPHPAHQAFVESLGPYVEKAFVVDYWASN